MVDRIAARGWHVRSGAQPNMECGTYREVRTVGGMFQPELQRLRRDHAAALFTFERTNRAFFAASIPDRGDDFFARFDERLDDLLTEQAAGLHHFHVLVDREGETGMEVLGRVNLVDVADGSAELGFRIAESATGRGTATAAVRQVCGVASADYELTTLRAATTLDNVGSRTVLERVGFVYEGETTLSGHPGRRYGLRLADRR